MAATENRTGARLMDRPEYPSKPEPLTCREDSTVAAAVADMTERNFGCIIVVNDDEKVTGIMTERDILKKLVDKGLDPAKTKVSELMTRNPRCAREDDQIIDWLRIMSNDRFRRLPVTDENGRIKAIFTQGDFVSYTWPDLLAQAGNLAKAQVMGRFPYFLIGGGILMYALAMIIVLSVI
ncbi:CBS domain-containing protein [Roseovarius nanhaiticus]|uniref:CBS domain-containing protein n=1 Tax=Roseovarius nanhaiticus TaxID=573024 RepID=A0A1N7H237_9RHOB|nr:CBS domain-containing protein [Roseovarius nanhaiticus]SEL15925.1 CBS domain-containing protein [Roseovarius nanhaiticus]SIS18902.1 CBS domain-containing protein [Roseovarius nanhaiticus]